MYSITFWLDRGLGGLGSELGISGVVDITSDEEGNELKSGFDGSSGD